MNQLLTSVPDAVCPHNLADTLSTWFVRLGFEVIRDDNYRLTHVQATWTDARGQLFTAIYVHYHVEGERHTALFSLFVRPAGAKGSGQCLISATHVRRGREVRMMLLANNYYKTARQAALDAGVLQRA